MTGLSDELNRLNVEGWSNRDIERIAERHGHRLHNSTVSNYMGGRHGKPTADKLAAFAAVFGVDVNDLRAAAGLPGLAEPFDLGAEGARLTGPQREAIRTTVRLFVEQNDALARDAESHGATSAGEKLHHRPGADTNSQRGWWQDFGLAADEGERRLDEKDAAARRAGEESQDPDDYR